MNRDILGQAVRRWVSGAESFNVVMEGEAETGPTAHPAVKAAIAEFQGEIVAVRAARRKETPVKGFGNMMKEAQKLQQQMEKMQAEVAQQKVDATAGGGMVTVEANGKQEIVSIKIDPEVINKDDAQMLEDLVLAACNEALRKSRDMMQQELGKLTGGLKIPGLGG